MDYTRQEILDVIKANVTFLWLVAGWRVYTCDATGGWDRLAVYDRDGNIIADLSL
jgi:hypothetical protein